MSSRRTRRSERGAILVQVGIAIVVLIGFCAFVMDYGVLWLSRREAQNSADAGALAGAIALAYDSATDRSDTGPAKVSAHTVALSNNVWLQPPNVQLTDITFPTCPDGSNGCVRVDVYRTQGRGNPLPVFFGPVIGVNSQGVQATATAEAVIANATKCMRPWAIPDKWQENKPTPQPSVPWSPTYDYDPTGSHPDVYMAPTTTSPGTGFTVANDAGLLIPLKEGSPVSAGYFQAIDLPQADGSVPRGGAAYRANIEGCAGGIVKIGDTLTAEPGNKVGPTKQGVSNLIAQDPTATWDPTTMSVKNSRFSGVSPRLVPIPIVDTGAWYQGGAGRNTSLTVVNILGFFIDHVDKDSTVWGYLTTSPGETVGSAPVGNPSSFLKTIELVR